MAAIKGNSCTLQYKAEASATADAISQTLTGYASIVGVTSASISVSNATFEATSITDETTETTVRDFAVGTTTCSLSVEGMYDPALADNAEELFDLCKAKTRIGVFWYNDESTQQAVGGVGYCTSFELSAGMDDFVTFSASFELEGNPVVKTLA
jgi:predicted secreted protein